MSKNPYYAADGGIYHIDHEPMIAHILPEDTALKLAQALNALDAITENMGGPDGFYADQIATFLGGLIDAHGVKGNARDIAESYIKTLQLVGGQVRAARDIRV